MNVLVVDDSAVMRAMIIRTLQMAGLELGEVHQAGDGVAGLGVLATESVDLALVDINMPTMDGERMIECIRQDSRVAALPVIVVSTEGSETRVEALRKHGVEFIRKPFQPQLLRETVLRIAGATP